MTRVAEGPPAGSAAPFGRSVRALVVPADPTLRTVYLVAATLVMLRSAVFVFVPQSYFDSDQAVIGLMAKHLSEGRALPIFIYGQNYMLAVEAWLAAPLFLVAGPSVTALKLPLVAMNIAIVWLTIGVLWRDGGLTPWLAFLAAIFVILPPPGTAAALVEAGGGNLEPFLYVLLLWIARRNGWAFGAIFAFGFRHREFTAYGLLAVLLVELLEGSLFTRANLQRKARALVSCAAVWIAITLLAMKGSAVGPGTTPADLGAPASNLGDLLQRFCGDIAALARSGPAIYHDYLANLFGLRVQPVSDFAISGQTRQGVPGLWIPAAILLVLTIGASAANTFAPPREARGEDRRVFVFFAAVGVVTLVLYVWGRCGELSVLTLRYGLLGLFGAVGLTAAALARERPRALRVAVASLVALWTAASVVGHVRLVAEYATSPPPNWRGIIADYLVERGVRYAEADYWTAYHVTFLSGERVIVANREWPRIAQYQRLIDQHRGETWTIAKERCATGMQVIPRWWICPPTQ